MHQPQTRSYRTLVHGVPPTSSNYKGYEGHVHALQESYRVGTHIEAEPRRMLRDDYDIRNLLTVFRLMTDPFSLYEDDDDISSSFNSATCVRMPFALA